MVRKQTPPALSRRERQILDVLYARGRATAADVRLGLLDPPSYSAVRTLLRILEEKGHVRHETEGARYVYMPTVSHGSAQRSAMRHVLETFFKGSATSAIAALLDEGAGKLSDKDFDRLAAMIAEARREGS
jgi:predicted transcriptional regulator